MFVVDIKNLIDYGKNNYATMGRNAYSGDRSWEFCHKSFLYFKDKYTDPQTMITSDELDYLCLQLGWYLASWGMLRNSFLRLYNHKIHEEAIKVIYDHKWDCLWNIDYVSLTKKEADLIVDLSVKLYHTYSPYLVKNTDDLTDTLKTKILLGTVACVPAYDQYFVSAIKHCGIKTSVFNSTSIMELQDIYKTYSAEFETFCAFCGTDPFYPSAKLLDMSLFSFGMKISKVEAAAKKQLLDRYPNFNNRKNTDKDKLTFLCLYAMHISNLTAVLNVNSRFKDVYNLNPIFYDAAAKSIS